jgi:hypothetical protein
MGIRWGRVVREILLQVFARFVLRFYDDVGHICGFHNAGSR